jgi:competence protein ComEC
MLIMRILIIAFTVGILSLQFLPTLPACQLPLAILLLAGLIALSGYYFPLKKIWQTIGKIFFTLSLGFNWALIYAHWALHWTLPDVLEGRSVITRGYIASLPKIETHRISFDFAADNLAGQKQNIKLLLSWYNDYPNYPELKVGDKWQLTVRLKRPHSTINPGQFDYEAHFLQNHIRAIGYVINKADNYKISSNFYSHPVNRLRQYLQVKINEDLPNLPLTNLITALVVGDQSGISQQEWQILRATGTVHFMVIAGLHIGFVFSLLFLLTKFIWKLWPRLTLIMPATEIAALFGLFGATIYSALAGFSIPTERALTMIGVFLLSIFLRFKIANWTALLLGLLIVITLDPLAGLSSGFWLSFAAVAFISYVLTERLAQDKKWQKYLKLQFTLTLGLMPLTLLLFQQATLVSFLGNAIAVPWIGFIVIPLSLSGSFLLFLNHFIGHFLLEAAELALELIWYWLTWLSTLPIASWHHHIFNNWILISSLVGVLLLLAPLGFPGRLLGGIWLLPLLFYKPVAPESGKIWFTLLDVGQGLAAVLETKNHVLIYDTGPKYSDDSNAGTSIIMPFLKSRGITKIDTLVISHGDQDHRGGAKSILDEFHVNQILTSTPYLFLPQKAEYCKEGQTWEWDGITFSILHPSKNSSFTSNNASCVLRIAAGKNSILLTGDIEKPAEESLAKNDASHLSATIIVAPHHGSRTSSSSALITAVNPQYVLFATGYRNRFHFPHKSVVKRYLNHGAILLNTTETGAITFKFDAKSGMLSPEIYRAIHKRYWRDFFPTKETL